MNIKDEAVEAAKRVRDTAMEQTMAARIPESGHFGAIAQDADWLVDHLPACQQEVERLRKKVDIIRSQASEDADDFTAHTRDLEARNAELVKALEPFAKVAGEWDGQPAELSIFLEWNDEPEAVPNVLVEDFRRARAALGGQSNE